MKTGRHPSRETEQVLIKVGACGLNNTDVNTRSGWYSKTVSEATTGGAYQEVAEEDPTWGGRPITFPRIQGADTVGTIVALGEGVSEALLNKRVMVDCWLRDWSDPDNMDKTGYFGSECNGGFAEYTVVDARNVGPNRQRSSLMRNWQHFPVPTPPQKGCSAARMFGAEDTVLVTGASGGVGSALVQLAKRRGATVIALASPAKHPDVKALCADHVLDRTPADLRAALKSATGKDMVSVVADIVGGRLLGHFD
jgi:NADPH:quinone reductase-like Zn-dependent oxidoreductase